MSEEMIIPEILVRGEDGTLHRVGRLSGLGVIGGVYPQTYECQLILSQRIDDDPTFVTTESVGIEGWSAMWVLISIDSTLAPTDLRLLAQFSMDGGNTWFDFEEGLWASLYWEDTDTATEINKCFLLPCGGMDEVRFVVTGTGTDATNYFTVTLRVRQFRGSFGVAHA